MNSRQTEEKITALYERLSRDDGFADADSNSIVNQKRYLEEYATAHNLKNCVHYTDDGYSGGTFERPSWKRLVEDIEAGKVGTVLAKDMSRIGRDYLQTGFYTEVLFRQKGIRFIAITNGVDSEDSGTSEFVPFLNIVKNIGSLGMASTKYPFFRIALLLYIAFQRNYSVVHPAPGKIPEQDAQSRLLHT